MWFLYHIYIYNCKNVAYYVQVSIRMELIQDKISTTKPIISRPGNTPKGGHVAAEYKHKSLFTIFFLFSGTTNMTYLLDHRTESIIDLTFSRAANRIKEYMAPGFHRRLCELRATATSAD